MSDEELAAIRARCEAATPGLWEQPAAPIGDVVYSVQQPNLLIASCAFPSDAQFIAHAREDIPALLLEIDRLLQKYERPEG